MTNPSLLDLPLNEAPNAPTIRKVRDLADRRQREHERADEGPMTQADRFANMLGLMVTALDRVVSGEDARLATAEAEVRRLESMLADAKYTVGQVLQGRDSAHAELADVLHDLQVAVGTTYASAPSAAIEAVRRLATAEAEVTRLRALVRRVISLTKSTDGDDLDPESEIPVGELYRVLYIDEPGTPDPVVADFNAGMAEAVRRGLLAEFGDQR